VRLVASGMSQAKVARELKIGKSTIYRILKSITNIKKEFKNDTDRSNFHNCSHYFDSKGIIHDN
jgi:DNA invertase Pin-like site-specific DNA recombinase